jgi:hypothetical protein
MVHLTDLTRRPRSYATLQCGPGPDDHVLPPPDLVYGVQRLARFSCMENLCLSVYPTLCTITVNHSCDPNAAFNMNCPDSAKWHMYALKRIAIGDPGQ